MMWIIIGVAIAAVALAAAAVTVIINRKRMRKVMDGLNAMLDSAIDGRFEESRFDESLQSSVETKLAQYLARSVSTEKNLSEEKDRIKELVADISHQTKTPIANIMLYGQLIQEQQLGMEQKGEEACNHTSDTLAAVNSLNEQAEKLNFLIQSLVKTSRLETGVFALHKSRGSVKKIIENAVGQAALSASGKDITIMVKPMGAKKVGMPRDAYETDIPGGFMEGGDSAQESADIEAVFDAKWTTEALYNIIDNAVKYTPIGGNIEITMEKFEMYCRISVKDNGIGISENEQSKVFTRFYRSPTVAGEKGVGIGLYLTRQILSAEDAYVKLLSEPGKGSTFSVYLPLA